MSITNKKIQIDKNGCEYLLAVEIDEKKTCQQRLSFEEKRQKALEERLNCEFIRNNTSKRYD